uniref:Uncharacterized protein n=1 Tax=Anguilla anguilla TaxID=7936 RepID=A0A0E9PUA2_ANGAN
MVNRIYCKNKHTHKHKKLHSAKRTVTEPSRIAIIYYS